MLDYSLEELSLWMKENGESAFRAKQVFSWIYKNVWDFEEMKNLPQKLVEKLKENFHIGIPEVIESFESTLDGTQKLLLAFNDGNIIESVIMKYKHGNSICISTQIGCRMGCKFCASTLEGRVRNLTAGEILSEVIIAQK
ncbi:23S rRNA (adenine(2503)-C(2))-methyltransferase RlmN, partial [Clostridium perfringens]|nr:23S rRNA (adenine(2503)-C(2))-methyltransferase RlmN [Clostridium perfringens]